MTERDDRETQTDREERARRRGAREDNTLRYLKGQAAGVTSFFFRLDSLCLLVSRPGGLIFLSVLFHCVSKKGETRAPHRHEWSQQVITPAGDHALLPPVAACQSRRCKHAKKRLPAGSITTQLTRSYNLLKEKKGGERRG